TYPITDRGCLARLYIAGHSRITGPYRRILEERRGCQVHTLRQGARRPFAHDDAGFQIDHRQADMEYVPRPFLIILAVDGPECTQQQQRLLAEICRRKLHDFELGIRRPDHLDDLTAHRGRRSILSAGIGIDERINEDLGTGTALCGFRRPRHHRSHSFLQCLIERRGNERRWYAGCWCRGWRAWSRCRRCVWRRSLCDCGYSRNEQSATD